VELEIGKTANYWALACQLHITDDFTLHLRQRLLHPLNVTTSAAHQILALAPVGSQGANLLRRTKPISQ
jgi:hypothetical protein